MTMIVGEKIVGCRRIKVLHHYLFYQNCEALEYIMEKKQNTSIHIYKERHFLSYLEGVLYLTKTYLLFI